jgi:hypothetical protein
MVRPWRFRKNPDFVGDGPKRVPAIAIDIRENESGSTDAAQTAAEKCLPLFVRAYFSISGISI